MLHAISQQHDSRDATVDLLSCVCLVLEVPTQRDAEWTQAIHLHNTAQHSTAAARTAHVSEHTGTQPQGPQARSRVFGCIWAGAGADSILRIQRSASVQRSPLISTTVTHGRCACGPSALRSQGLLGGCASRGLQNMDTQITNPGVLKTTPAPLTSTLTSWDAGPATGLYRAPFGSRSAAAAPAAKPGTIFTTAHVLFIASRSARLLPSASTAP